jgi:signal peptide peptidase SppA
MRPDTSKLSRRLCLDTPLVAGEALAVMLNHAQGPKAAEWELITRWREELQPEVEILGDIAVVEITGVLAKKPDPYEMALCGVEDMDGITRMLKQVIDASTIKGVLLKIDSPGGFVVGTPELGDLVAKLSALKPTVAFTDCMMCSAAYWIASQAGYIVASKSSIIGSIGVYSSLVDFSKYYESLGIKVEVFTNEEGTLKAAGLTGTSLTNEQRDNFQSRCQRDFDAFKAAVLTKRTIPDEAMKGQTFNGTEAIGNGLVDMVGDEDEAMFALRQLINRGQLG